MGNEKSAEEVNVPNGCKLYSTMSLTSPQQQEYIRQILSKRGSVFLNQHICTVSGYQFLQVQPNKISCQQSKQLVIFYDNFDYLLSDIPIRQYKFNQNDICNLLYCITDALRFLKSHNYRHGDISPSNICKKGSLWRLIDKTFIKNGVTAYQRILQGQQGFISPEQMQRIRYGFVRQSPPITQKDDIFALGMILLQMATHISSLNCYKESFIRFNQQNIQKALQILQKKSSKQFFKLVKDMLNPQEQQRIGLEQIQSHPLVRNNNKQSLKLLQQSVVIKSLNGRRVSLKDSHMLQGMSTKQQSPLIQSSSNSQSRSLQKRYSQKYSFSKNYQNK